LTRHDDVDEEEIDTLAGMVFMLRVGYRRAGEVVDATDGRISEVHRWDPRRINGLRSSVMGAGFAH